MKAIIVSVLAMIFCTGIFIASTCYMQSTQAPDNSIAALKKTLSQVPNDHNARLLLAQAYKKEATFDEAITVLTERLRYEPDQADLLGELANTYNWVNKFDEALFIYKELNHLLPNNTTILNNIALTLRLMERLDETFPYYDKALQIDPSNTYIYFQRGMASLILGDFEKGLAGYEYRFIPSLPPLLRLDTTPRWDGSDLQGKIILIHNAEQSFGDTFQFIRYAQMVKEKNGIIIAAVHRQLIPMIKLCPYIDHVISKDEAPPFYDVHAPIMSLPYILQTRVDSIPNQCPYLNTDEQLVAYWKQQLTPDKNFKIGICWQASEDQKSIKLKQLIPLCTIPNTTIYSLQQVDGTEQLADLPNTITIVTFDDDFDQNNKRFMDSAAVIKNLDLIITVDTSIAHLAAGLGVNTWVLLPKPADWRWMINRNDSPWYPTMRLFRQPAPGNWKTVIEEVVQELTHHIPKIQKDF